MPRIRATFHLLPATVNRLRDAAVALAGSPHFTTIGEIVNDAIERHLEHLQHQHNGGAPFPARRSNLKGGRPVRYRRPKVG